MVCAYPRVEVINRHYKLWIIQLKNIGNYFRGNQISLNHLISILNKIQTNTLTLPNPILLFGKFKWLSACFHLIKTSGSHMTGIKTNSNCTVVEMGEFFPFGELKEVANDDRKVLVRKKLVYSNDAELDIVRKMVSLLHTLTNQHLIQLQHFQLMGDQTFYFYYEYVPLTLDKWILDIGDDIIEQLQFQMLFLANYLTQHNIKFRFDPKWIGLSKSIKLKYFLHEFMIDSQNKMNNYKEVQKEIISFFDEFKVMNSKTPKISTHFTDRKSADSYLLLNRIELLSSNGRDSWETSHHSLVSNKSKRNQLLSQKVINSKKKSMEILERLKKMKSQNQE